MSPTRHRGRTSSPADGSRQLVSLDGVSGSMVPRRLTWTRMGWPAMNFFHSPGRHRRVLFSGLILGLFALVWYWSPLVPVLCGTYHDRVPLVFSPDGEVLAVGIPTADGKNGFRTSLRLLHLADGSERVMNLQRPGLVAEADTTVGESNLEHVAYSPDGRIVSILVSEVEPPVPLNVPMGRSAHLFLSDQVTGKCDSIHVFPSSWQLLSPAFSADGRWICWSSLGDDRESEECVVYDLEQRRVYLQLPDERSPIISADGRLLGTFCYRERVFCLRDLHAGDVLLEVSLEPDRSRATRCFAFTSDGQYALLTGLFTAGDLWQRGILILDLRNGKITVEFQDLDFGKTQFALSTSTLMIPRARAVFVYDTRTWQLQYMRPFASEQVGEFWQPSNVVGCAVPVVALLEHQERTLPAINRIRAKLGWPWIESQTRIVVFNAGTGREQSIRPPTSAPAHFAERPILAEQGNRIAQFVEHNRTTYVWSIPGRRSWLPTVYLATALAAALLLRQAVRRWHASPQERGVKTNCVM